MLLARVDSTLCYLGFTDSINDLQQRWPDAKLNRAVDSYSRLINSGQRPLVTLYGTPLSTQGLARAT